MNQKPSEEEILFEVKSSLGKMIRTTKPYWQKIVKNKHPKMRGKQSTVMKTLRCPEQIRISKSDDSIHLYYLPYKEYFLCVVAKHLNEDGFIVTAYITDTIKEGELVWEK